MSSEIKPLFIPLKKTYYEQFVDGSKSVEYRKYGPGWNERTCIVGRSVVISLGYSKNRRSRGVIRSFDVIDSSNIPSAREVYGVAKINLAAIGIELTEIDFQID
ncbi:MAG: hypothetical protein HC836_25765 [Richelia sp. RM2_1_2]|nr:hypothetical protein [Richelia sp. RM2_1_2]